MADDLRTLGAEAIRRHDVGSRFAPASTIEALANAVLAAVLPAIADAIEPWQDRPDRECDPATYLRRLAGLTGSNAARQSEPVSHRHHWQTIGDYTPRCHCGVTGWLECACHPGVVWSWHRWPVKSNAWGVMGRVRGGFVMKPDGTPYCYRAGTLTFWQEHQEVSPRD